MGPLGPSIFLDPKPNHAPAGPDIMPVILRQDGYKFFFYANEGNPREPIHIHVRKDAMEAKFFLTTGVQDRL